MRTRLFRCCVTAVCGVFIQNHLFLPGNKKDSTVTIFLNIVYSNTYKIYISLRMTDAGQADALAEHQKTMPHISIENVTFSIAMFS
jgi:hypothetical protein